MRLKSASESAWKYRVKCKLLGRKCMEIQSKVQTSEQKVQANMRLTSASESAWEYRVKCKQVNRKCKQI